MLFRSGMHGANATGRPFTGDHAGILLYKTLYKFGFASAPESTAANDRLRLRGCRITNAVKCLPPENKPNSTEVANCNSFLRAELQRLPGRAVILVLGRVAHHAVLRALELKSQFLVFRHGAEYRLDSGCTLLESYHCSRYNTQTRRLTAAMFEAIIQRAQELVKVQG